MKVIKNIIIKWIVIIFLGLFTISLVATSPIPSIGWIIMLFGIYQLIQKRKGKVTFSKPGIIIASGIALFVILSGSTSDVEKEVSTDSEKVAVSTSETKKANEDTDIANQEVDEEDIQIDTEAKLIQKQEEDKENLATSLGLVAATVSRVVDGDTLELSDGSKVRLVGVNTPESTTRAEEYGKEASSYTKSKIEGKQIYLQKDVSDTDRYSRLLRIVWTDLPTDINDENEIRSKMFNADLIINGYAEPSTYPPDVTYSEYFVKFAKEAREKEVGLWSYGENGTTKGDLDTSTSTSSNSTPSNTTPTYSVSESYKNCTEMRKVYPSGVASDHPAYASKHDKDKDGYACEK